MQTNNQLGNPRRRTTRTRNFRRGYVLVLCMIVIAISSSIVLTTFHLLKLHTAEASARRDLVTMDALLSAGKEHAIAHLIDQPTYRGPLGIISIPQQSQQNYQVQISDVSGDIQIDVTATLRAISQVSTTRVQIAALDARRAALGLASAQP